jgi:hypothetical protein
MVMLDQLLSMATKAFPSLGGPGVDLRKEISQIAHDFTFKGMFFTVRIHQKRKRPRKQSEDMQQSF